MQHSGTIRLEDLEDYSPDNAIAKRFGEMLRMHGYAVVSVPEPIKKTVADTYSFAKKFFADTPSTVKDDLELVKGKEAGYKLQMGIKELLMLRYEKEGLHTPWKSSAKAAIASAGNSQVPMDFFNHSSRVAKACLGAVSIYLGVEPQKLWSLLDAEPLPSKQRLRSCLARFFHYFNSATATEIPCKDHQDLGLLTLIPTSDVSGLQVFSMCDMCPSLPWETPEEMAQPGDYIILAGETLSYLTNGYFTAAMHRVVDLGGHVPRHSIVFLVRANDDAVVDPANLGSKEIPHCSFKPVTAGKLVASEKNVRQSVNSLY